jgi:hypothetical protein
MGPAAGGVVVLVGSLLAGSGQLQPEGVRQVLRHRGFWRAVGGAVVRQGRQAGNDPVVEVGRALVQRWLPGLLKGGHWRQDGVAVEVAAASQRDHGVPAACEQLLEAGKGTQQQQQQQQQQQPQLPRQEASASTVTSVAEAAVELLRDLQGWYPQLLLQPEGLPIAKASTSATNSSSSSSSGNKGAVAESQKTSVTHGTGSRGAQPPAPTSKKGDMASAADTSSSQALDQRPTNDTTAPASTISTPAHSFHTSESASSPKASSSAAAVTSASSTAAHSSSTGSFATAASTVSSAALASRGEGASSSSRPQGCIGDASSAAAAAAPEQKICGHCGAEGAVMLCGGCEALRYCSPACQKAHWKVHRPQCKQLQRQKASGTGSTPASAAAVADAGSA